MPEKFDVAPPIEIKPSGIEAVSSITPEALEKKNKILRLYEKAVHAQEFETAENLDTSIIPPEELAKVRIIAFDKLVDGIKRYNDGHYSSLKEVEKKITEVENGLHVEGGEIREKKEIFFRDYIEKKIDTMYWGKFSGFGNTTYADEVKEWKEKTNLTDEDFGDLVENGYLRHQQSLTAELKAYWKHAHEARDRYREKADAEKRAEEYQKELPNINEASLTKVLKELGIKYSPEQKKILKEKGFIAFLEAEGSYSYTDKEKIDFALKVSNLKEDSLTSGTVEKIVVDKFADSLKSISFDKKGRYNEYPTRDNKDLYQKVRNLSSSILFPKDLSKHPEVQVIIDAKFKEISDQLKIKDNTLVPSEYLAEEIGEYSRRSEQSEQKALYDQIENLTNLAKSMRVSTEALNATELRSLTSKYTGEYFKDKKREIIYDFGLNREVLQALGVKSEELDKNAEGAFLSFLQSNDPDALGKLSDINKNFAISDQFKKSSDVVTAEVNFFENLVNLKGTQRIGQFLFEIELPKSAIESEYFRGLKEEIIRNALSEGLQSVHYMKLISEKLDLSNCKEFLHSEEVQGKLKEIIEMHVRPIIPKVTDGYSYGYERKWFKLEEGDLAFNITESHHRAGEGVHELVRTINLANYLDNKELVKGTIIEELNQQFGQVKNISALERLSKLSDELEIFGVEKQAAQELLITSLIQNIGEASYSVEEKDHTGRAYSRDYLFVPRVDNIDSLKKEFKLNTEQTRRLALASFNFRLMSENNMGGEEAAKDIFDAFKLTMPEAGQAVKDRYFAYIAKGWNDMALKVKKDFNLQIDSNELDIGIQRAFISSLERGHVDIKQTESLSAEFLKTDKVQSLGKALFLKELNTGHENDARNTKKILLLDVTVEDITSSNPKAKAFIDRIQEKFPSLAEKYLGSVDAFMSIYSQIGNERIFHSLEENPFLSEALINNEQYGLKLLFKFDSFDKLSKKNIETLYASKEQILQNSQIDPNSRDFRIAMQNKLAEYRRNSEIMETMRKNGVDVEAWLNYEEELFFDLGAEKAAVSEQIRPAVERILESVEVFISSHKEVIGEYEKEMTAHKIASVDSEKIQGELDALRESLRVAQGGGDIKKVTGIERGIASLENQIKNPKMVTAWSRFIGDMGRTALLRKDIVSSVEALKKSEDKIEGMDASGLGPREKRKEAQKIKDEIEKKKSEIIQKAGKLETQLISLDEVRTYLMAVVGKDRGIALDQEIADKISEPLDHCMTDFETIKTTLSDKKEDELEGTTLRVGIWDRNPDTDLYMGNYTNCCIRIDSDHMGEESVIADYLTDEGIQVVGIYDEKKKIPVAAAWCWIGNDDDDNKAFVIDNVEANTEYSTKYKAEMEKQMKEFIKKYAKESGVSKVVQGRANNDLDIAKMDSAYFKVGGYNRASGYFLEGEDNHVGGGEEEE